jgi:hypothetical protein
MVAIIRSTRGAPGAADPDVAERHPLRFIRGGFFYGRVLTLLLLCPGELVGREEFQRVLWPGETFVEFDKGLNKAIQKLRQALDDSSDNPRFIETLLRKGYRFIAPVDRTAGEALRRNPLRWTATR